MLWVRWVLIRCKGILSIDRLTTLTLKLGFLNAYTAARLARTAIVLYILALCVCTQFIDKIVKIVMKNSFSVAY